jgi:hypothetical protein
MAAGLSITQQSVREERQMTTRQWLLASAVVLPLLAAADSGSRWDPADWSGEL